MADIGENLRSVIVASTGVLAEMPGVAAPGACLHNVVLENPPTPRIWYSCSNSDEELDIGGSGGLVESEFDIEVVSDDLDEAQDIAAAVKRLLNGKRGTFGTQTVQGVFVSDQTDEYVPRSLADETGYTVVGLRARIFYSST